MRKKLTYDFWGLHKNMNWVFPLGDMAEIKRQYESIILLNNLLFFKRYTFLGAIISREGTF